MEGRDAIRRLLRLPLSRHTAAREVGEEIEFHLAERAEALEEKGLSPAEAREQALREYGSVERSREELGRLARRRVERARWRGMLEALRQDLRLSLRVLARQPLSTALIVGTIALGIGVNGGMFAITDRLLFRAPEGVVEPERVKRVELQALSESGQVRTWNSTSWLNVEPLERVPELAAVAGYFPSSATFGRGREATRGSVLAVSGGFFPLLGARPALGRFFAAGEDIPGDPRYVAVLSHDYWRRGFGGHPGVVGTTLVMGRRTYEVVGVAPRGFTGIDRRPVEVFVPVAAYAEDRFGERWRSTRGMNWVRLVARLAPGASTEAAAGRASSALFSELRPSGPRPGDAVLLRPVIEAQGRNGNVALLLQGVSLLVLLIAAANVANLLLSRSLRRRAELGVRLALGVSRKRLAVQVLVDALVLSTVGGALGVLLAGVLGAAAQRTLLPGLAWGDVLLDGRTMAFSGILVVVAAIAAGAIPAMHAGSVAIRSLADLGGRARLGRSRAGRLLIASQAAFSALLLVGAGLFVRSFQEAASVDLGFDADRVIMASWDQQAVERSDESWLRLYDDAAERVREVPGVGASSLAASVPFWSNQTSRVRVAGRDTLPGLGGAAPLMVGVTPGYFETVGLQVRQGRGLRAVDGPGGAPVAVVGASFAEAVWPDEDPIGRCFFTEEGEGWSACMEVVGVVEEAAWWGIDAAPPAQFYVPLAQRPEMTWRWLMVSTTTPDPAVAGRVQSLLQGLEPGLPYADVRFMRDLTSPYLRSWRIGAAIFTVFGVVGLILAVIGVVGVLGYEVDRRTREIGIRVALGAPAGGIVRMVLSDAGRLLGTGVAAGLVMALLVSERIRPLLFQGSPRDPLVFVGAALVLAVAGVMAGALPARRAAGLDPAEVLKGE